MAYEKPVPVVDADSRPYWDGAKQNKLMIQRCKKTGQTFLYSRVLVPGTDPDQIEWIEAKGTGSIYSYTIARRPAGPAFKEDCPYVIASIELDEGARILTNILTDDPGSLKIGQKVQVTFDAVTDDLTIPKFKVVG